MSKFTGASSYTIYPKDRNLKIHGARPKQKCYPAPDLATPTEHGATTRRNLLYSHFIEPSHGGAGKEDHEGFGHPFSEEVATVKLHHTKPSTTALVVAHELPCKPLTTLGSQT